MIAPGSSREPLSTYDQALWRLVEHFEAHAIKVTRDDPLPFAALLVGEIFWVNPSRVRRDLLNRIRDLDFSALPRRHGRLRYGVV